MVFNDSEGGTTVGQQATTPPRAESTAESPAESPEHTCTIEPPADLSPDLRRRRASAVHTLLETYSCGCEPMTMPMPMPMAPALGRQQACQRQERVCVRCGSCGRVKEVRVAY